MSPELGDGAEPSPESAGSASPGGGGPRLTIGEHLEELRRRLAWGLAAVLVVVIVGLCFQDELMVFVTVPHRRAMAWAEARRPARPDPVSEALARARASRGEESGRALADAVEALAKREDAQRGTLVALRFTEPFLSYLKLALVAGCLGGGPILLYQLWRFVGSGLYPHERRSFLGFLPLSVGLFVVGLAFGYVVLVPATLAYLASYGDPEVMRNSFAIGPYLSLFLGLTMAVGLSFQVPVVMLVARRLFGVPAASFRQYRRHAILVAAVVAALVTPSPDPMSMMCLMVPLILLYELGNLLVRLGP